MLAKAACPESGLQAEKCGGGGWGGVGVGPEEVEAVAAVAAAAVEDTRCKAINCDPSRHSESYQEYHGRPMPAATAGIV